MSQQKYDSAAWTVGMRRVYVIANDEQKLGNVPYWSGKGSNLPDMVIVSPKDSTRIIRVYEVTNYISMDEYVDPDRAIKYRENLLQFKDAEKVFVCSFEENLRYLPNKRKFFEDFNIKVQLYGAQS